jgi:hypothetical protein
MTGVPTQAQIRAQVRAVWEKGGAIRVIGIRAPVTVDVGDVLQVAEAELPVARCGSVLEVRERLTTSPAADVPLVLITPLDERELGADVVARLAKRHLFAIDPWQLVKDRFHARYVDPRLVQRHGWVARALLEAEPDGGYPPAPSGFIQAEGVWRVLFESLLGLPGGVRDAEALLGWSLTADNRQRLGALDPEARASLSEAVGEGTGAVARRIFDCAAGGHSDSTFAIGLVARVLYGEAAEGDKSATKATGKLDAWLGSGELRAEEALAWADAAEQVLRRRLAGGSLTDVQPLLQQADAILAQLGALDAAHRSRFLRAGYEQRLGAFADALQGFVKGKAKALPGELVTAGEAVLDHLLASAEAKRAERVEMALRLARWLAVRRAQGDTVAGSLADAARAYRLDGAFVDWARSRLWDGDPLAALGHAYTLLWESVGRAREDDNRRFGELLANWSATGSHDASVIPVETVLSRVVAPLAKVHPVLLVVVDGMGVAVCRELQPDLVRRGWVEVDAVGTSHRVPVIAALPTVTEVCRTSLLCGRLMVGTAVEEKAGFAKHAALLEAGSSAKPPLLFHKGDLSGGDGVGVSPTVLATVADLQRRVLGVVINAVDDHLAKGDQIRFDWDVHRIRPLEELLSAARDAGRALVIVSDHGHVPEHNTVARGADESERWREATSALQPDEVLLSGPRVLLGKDRRLIAPWSERIRFGTKKNGYHGGAAPQEVVIPLGVYLPSGVSLVGWAGVAPEIPPWWEPDMAVAPVAVTARPVKPKAKKAAETHGDLFAAVPGAGPEWLDRLMASEAMQAQQQLAARVALPQERVRAILVALDERGGKLTRPALAKRLDVPVLRLAGMLSALRRVLNVDGYAVLSVDEASDTVELNKAQLLAQFGL